MTDSRTMEWVVRNACFSADIVAMERTAAGDTGAQVTEAIIKRSLEALVANGIIAIKDPDDWPPFYVPDPPYKSIFEGSDPE